MGEAIGQVLASAVGVAVSPMPMVAIVLMLATARGRANGSGFTIGFVGGLAVVTVLVTVLGSGLSGSASSGPPAWARWLKLLLGLVFVLLGLRQWRNRPREGQPAEQPSWMAAIDSFSTVKAVLLGLAFSVANPKNLVLAIGAAVGVATSPSGAAGKTLAVLVFLVIASLCTTVPLGVYLLGGDTAAATLASWKAWMAEHNSAIMTVLFLVLGTKYVGDAIAG